MTFAALTDAQIRVAQIVVLGSAFGVVATLLIVRFWVWAIVGWAVADLRRKNVLPGLSWEQAVSEPPERSVVTFPLKVPPGRSTI